MTGNMMQLGLPFDFGVMHTWTDSAGPASTGLDFTVSLTPTGAQLDLVGPWPSESGPRQLLPLSQPSRGVLWRATVDMADPAQTEVAPGPDFRTRIGSEFSTRLPFSDCFTAPMAWAHLVGRHHGIPVEGLLMAMRRTLVTVARHLERLEAGGATTNTARVVPAMEAAAV